MTLQRQRRRKQEKREETSQEAMSATVKNISATVDIDANLAFICVSSFLFHLFIRPSVSSSLIMFGCDFLVAFTQWVMFRSTFFFIRYRPGFAFSCSRREAFISSPFSARGRPLETRGSNIGADLTHVNCPRRRPLCGRDFVFVYYGYCYS